MSAVSKLAQWLGFGPPGHPRPIRAGVLNTGELVLIDHQGAVQVLSAEGTDTVRDVLFADNLTVSDRVMLAAGSTGSNV